MAFLPVRADLNGVEFGFIVLGLIVKVFYVWNSIGCTVLVEFEQAFTNRNGHVEKPLTERDLLAWKVSGILLQRFLVKRHYRWGNRKLINKVAVHRKPVCALPFRFQPFENQLFMNLNVGRPNNL
jgi:hypothetical protein